MTRRVKDDFVVLGDLKVSAQKYRKVLAHMRRLTRSSRLAEHQIKVFRREISKELPEVSRMHAQYRRRNKNRNKR